MKTVILQLNFVVGDIRGNARKILLGYETACKQGADLVVSTELALFGYPPKDMLERKSYLDLQDEYLAKLMAEIREVGLIVGVARKNYEDGKPIYNSAVLIEQGQIRQVWNKVLLPNHDVFSEYRYFEPGRNRVCVFFYRGHKVSLLVCEDIWNGDESNDGHKMYFQDPVTELKGAGSDILIVINGSPYYWGKGDVRFNLVSDIAKKLDCTVVYANQVGGQDELVFDGRSFAVNQYGRCIAAARPFEEDIVVFDTFSSGKVNYHSDTGRLDQLYNALVLSVRDYFRKSSFDSGGFDSAVIGLSGGIDSALTACIAVDALGKENVVGLSMPSEFSSPGSVADASQLAEDLGIKFHIVSISDVYNAIGEVLNPVIGWYKPGTREGDVTEENVQARIRGMFLMAFTNRVHPGKRFMVLTTGNKSEGSEGYFTLYGDSTGGFAPLKDIYKTLVYELARYKNRQTKNLIPLDTITKPPSAELRHNQKDTDSLPDYDILDKILELHIEGGRDWKEILAMTGFNGDEVRKAIRRVNSNEYKRWQYPPGTKVTTKAFGSGRQWPITGSFLD